MTVTVTLIWPVVYFFFIDEKNFNQNLFHLFRSFFMNLFFTTKSILFLYSMQQQTVYFIILFIHHKTLLYATDTFPEKEVTVYNGSNETDPMCLCLKLYILLIKPIERTSRACYALSKN